MKNQALKMIYRVAVVTGLILMSATFVSAATFENAAGTEIDQWSGGASDYTVGQIFTASSNHTVTSADMKFSNQLGILGASGYLHLASVSGGVIGSDLAVSPLEADVSQVLTGTFSCVALTSGNQYALWFQYASAGYDPVVGIAGSGLAYGTGGSPTLAPSHTYAESTQFTIYGDTGGCGGGGGGGTVATSTTFAAGTYFLLFTSIGLFLIQLVGYLLIFYIVTLLVAWPIRKLVAAFRRLIKRSGNY